ncbi:MAG TPA: gamma-glutamyl-gamma-aminobutyrate hydrolase family protein [Anaerolineales bacterium]|nr:gamma-glutamyl-gamma-aminobutyrate hydrolase family protein [Anaerolineales bacterium]HMX75562.1 gamma-glutamyl-gamma-aminobutyrate hydrolase family protein [Anaerolineales bacterium]HNA56194.1 gamma-glutamyl-gamma-aminobutyrate hydrolase family protein [Anaerolineales bacterium]HUM25230.1 gamma-glutamyl-gamma-aminobutyrate hydrolase family protein [Anaerolineales bacterium]
MPKPLIGITTRNGKDADGHPLTALQHSYINAIVQAGGMPILIPSMLSEEDFTGLYSLLAGILFTGGGDVSLEYFNGSDHPRIGEVDKRRDTTEITLMRAAVNDGKPLLGICRGAQVMNVALGGTLYTHIHDQVNGALDHDYPGDLRKVIVHPVNVDESTRSAEIFGETLLHVNSLHHQGLKDIAPGLRVAGHAPDGLVEVVEIPDHPYAVAVQWHPEWLTDQPAMQKLFKSFVDAAG